MLEPFLVIDNLLPAETADHIENVLMSEINWKFISDITFNTLYQNTPAFVHVFKNVEWGTGESQFLPLVQPIIDEACKRINYKMYSLQKSRTFLQVPLHNNFTDVEVDTLHTDQQYPHLVLLYYVFDADGDTVIVDHKRDEIFRTDLKVEDYTELVRVQPKKNRIVIFDGNYYHTAYQPRNGLRCIINFNLLGEFL